MVELSPTLVVILMFGGLLVALVSGYPLFICLGGIAMAIGLVTIGEPVFVLMRTRVTLIMTNYILLAAPLFIFMGLMIEKSGAAERLYTGLHLCLGGFRGGLAVVTILMGTILAACVGVIAASVTMMGLIALPSMLKRGYNKELACGSVCAGGTLGILIPPSVMLVFYGPMAQISVGKLFMGAFIPGFLLAGLYISYIAVRCWLKADLAPAISTEEKAIPRLKKLSALLTGMVPPVFIILSVLGTIFFGIATPTEAAAVGCVASMILARSFRQFNLQNIKEVALGTMRFTCMGYAIGFGASIFTGVFLRLGGGEVIATTLLAVPGGKWATFAIIMFIMFILGMFIDWIGILFVMIPLITPIGNTLFDPLWFAMMVCINLQMSFMTPPFAMSIFFLKGLLRPEWEIDINHIIRGVIPFVVLIIIAIGLCIAFPQIILWLPHQMIKF